GSSAASSAASALVQNPPANTAVPSISGSALVEDTLSATRGTWTGYPAPAISYQWQRSTDDGATWQTISGQSTDSYTLIDSDIGAVVRARVTATNASGAASPNSASSGAIAGVSPANSAVPVLSGTASVGLVLSVSTGTWTAAPAATFAYQWQDCDVTGANCLNVVGATNASY